MDHELLGWKVRVFRQGWHVPWCAIAQKTIDNIIHVFNVEGYSEDEAWSKMQQAIHHKEGKPLPKRKKS